MLARDRDETVSARTARVRFAAWLCGALLALGSSSLPSRANAQAEGEPDAEADVDAAAELDDEGAADIGSEGALNVGAEGAQDVGTEAPLDDVGAAATDDAGAAAAGDGVEISDSIVEPTLGDEKEEVIVVTAQFREQNPQQTPIAITAISGKTLEERSQVSLADIGDQVPNVRLSPAPGVYGPAVQAHIRGVGQHDFNFAFEPGVGIYVDDVYYATLTGTTLDLLDLQRIEILRGPQGTLAGQNSIGGAIRAHPGVAGCRSTSPASSTSTTTS